jgi:SAM-dependent methyltransferase
VKPRINVLQAIREAEVTDALALLPQHSKLLELGGGDGFQARILADAGHEVVSIDVAPRQPSYFPVLAYDGQSIPFPDARFDAVFSSNVLEHVKDLDRTFSELRRVLKANALAVHIVPAPVWRVWTTLTHYAWLAQLVGSKLTGVRSTKSGSESPSPVSRRPSMRKALGLDPHGEYSNALAELYYFSRRRWERVFRSNGFRVLSHSPGNLFYTGHLLLPSLSISARRKLAASLGSACHVFVTRAE